MESSTALRVLVVAHRTAATPALLEAVRKRAAQGPSVFTLLVPNSAHGLHRVTDPEDQAADEAQSVLELALPLLEDAAGAPVEGIVRIGSGRDASDIAFLTSDKQCQVLRQTIKVTQAPV